MSHSTVPGVPPQKVAARLLVAAGPALQPTPGAVDPPPPHLRLPVHQMPPRDPGPGQETPRWWWLGCHGGAGVSTLHHLIPGGGDALRCWPDPRLGGPSGVMLVCRSHQWGMTAASAAIRQWMAGLIPPAVRVWGLVIVADAPGRLPRPLAAQRSRLAGTVERTFFVPWVESWRLDSPTPQDAPREIAALGQGLRSRPWLQQKGQ